MEEYHEIEEAVNNQRWKSAFIHMTAILEYCITDWGIEKLKDNQFTIFNDKGKAENYKFSNQKTSLWAKLKYVVDKGCEKFQDIGNKIDWEFVQNIFRPFRNYVHLKALEQSNQPVEIHHYQSLRPIFDKLIKYF